MYICDFSRSDGAGKATNRNTRGLTRSVMARIVPPLPAPSRPSNRIITRSLLCFTQSWRWHNSAWSLRSSFSYFLRLSFLSVFIGERIRGNGKLHFGLDSAGGAPPPWLFAAWTAAASSSCSVDEEAASFGSG